MTDLRPSILLGAVLLGFSLCSSPSYLGKLSKTDMCGKLWLWPIPAEMSIVRAQKDEPTGDVLTTRARLNYLALIAEIYCRHNSGTYPESFAELKLVKSFVAVNSDCHFDDHLALDAWDTPIYYGVRGGIPIALSAGPDKRFSTEDDIGFAAATAANVRQAKPDEQCGP